MPKMRWHPTTGENNVFGDDDPIPDGWIDHHPEDPKHEAPQPAEPAKAPPPKPADKDPNAPLTRKEVLKAMKDGGLEVKAEDDTDALTLQLVTVIKKVLTDGKVAFAEDASPRALLALVSPK